MYRVFEDRRSAGRALVPELQRLELEDPIILGLPRGGIPLAYEIATALRAPLDTIVVRKLGVPSQPELAFGAIASGGIRVINDDVIESLLSLDEETIESIAGRELQELRRREQAYRLDRPYPDLGGKDVVLVDDGLATGATMHAAAEAVKTRLPASVVDDLEDEELPEEENRKQRYCSGKPEERAFLGGKEPMHPVLEAEHEVEQDLQEDCREERDRERVDDDRVGVLESLGEREGSRATEELPRAFIETPELDERLTLTLIRDLNLLRPIFAEDEWKLIAVGAVLGLGDGGAHCGTICDGSFPTFMLSYWVRDRTRGERLSLSETVRMLSRDAARAVGLEDRGVIAPGYKADLNVIDLDQLRLYAPEVAHDLPTGGRRLVQRADGYCATIVSGRIVHRNGSDTGELPGRLVRGPQAAPRSMH